MLGVTTWQKSRPAATSALCVCRRVCACVGACVCVCVICAWCRVHACIVRMGVCERCVVSAWMRRARARAHRSSWSAYSTAAGPLLTSALSTAAQTGAPAGHWPKARGQPQPARGSRRRQTALRACPTCGVCSGGTSGQTALRAHHTCGVCSGRNLGKQHCAHVAQVQFAAVGIWAGRSGRCHAKGAGSGKYCSKGGG